LGDILDGIQASKFTDRLFSAFDEFKASLRDRASKPKASINSEFLSKQVVILLVSTWCISDASVIARLLESGSLGTDKEWGGCSK
jgi:hypothetical protein